MLNECLETLPPSTMKVLEGVTFDGHVNVSDETLLEHVRYAIRQGHRQVRPDPPKPDRMVLVGGGPSLAATFDELRALVFDGAKLVTVNGAYHWCLERNLKPSMQIVMDARASNVRFVEPDVPKCRYVLASQCHPSIWDAVQRRPEVWIFHATLDQDGPMRAELDAYYLSRWFGVAGGTTVISRALTLLRMLGYLRFDLFGVDCCWLEDAHHAYPQPENDGDRHLSVNVALDERREPARRFIVAPWMLKQFEDLLQTIRVNGDQFLLQVHGNGLLAYALRASADLHWTLSEEDT